MQKTLQRSVAARGVGLHSGRVVTVRLHPADPGAGITFVRVDETPARWIAARTANVVDTRMATTIGDGTCSVGTIEHLMAALAGLGVDNARVEVDGPEVPAMDGSAGPFLKLIEAAGIEEQSAPRRYLEILEPVEVREGDKFVRLEPFDGFRVAFEIDFDHPLIARQRFSADVGPEAFARQLGRARTFGFLHEVEYLKRNGLAQGGSLDNAVVLGDDGVLNRGGLRFPDEFVRHKVLDLLGDLYLCGLPLIGRVVARKSGHALHHALLAELEARPGTWCVVERRRSDAEVRPVPKRPRPAVAVAVA
ncbi:UDP-3-O-acyl-N-acetylglucosamine deacetylase [Dissulfurirhabdus thermomarina]|uniref:UDP-3-O-acyl-N-acetylglucosamine deacetylase n=1 Tax=Dissulfurirhabdus thermomarina TaxID=1765737 RepID=A0A6N9TL05_DISTH|nr:UDP-3-O-acyl-N-acetylglucosamine deacetylase [Dissulfurirhabdus thermomarina]NDY41748.1 UDP-3-O-acyl-N-acetylglucosamine deacetylase [Dissulfurirhabdus thermomarina]NMX24041.1 UDP-3-O-acyl-N-acetylglucosamine deacetylase [Dissulfurirhabdus thermomarina]